MSQTAPYRPMDTITDATTDQPPTPRPTDIVSVLPPALDVLCSRVHTGGYPHLAKQLEKLGRPENVDTAAAELPLQPGSALVWWEDFHQKLNPWHAKVNAEITRDGCLSVNYYWASTGTAITLTFKDKDHVVYWSEDGQGRTAFGHGDGDGLPMAEVIDNMLKLGIFEKRKKRK